MRRVVQKTKKVMKNISKFYWNRVKRNMIFNSEHWGSNPGSIIYK